MTPLVDPPFTKAELLSLPDRGAILAPDGPLTAKYLEWSGRYRTAVMGSEAVEDRLGDVPQRGWPLSLPRAAKLMMKHVGLARGSLRQVETYIALLMTVVGWFERDELVQSEKMFDSVLWAWCEIQHALLKVAFEHAGLRFPYEEAPAIQFDDGTVRALDV